MVYIFEFGRRMDSNCFLEEFGRLLDSNYFSSNKIFWQTIRCLRGKNSSATYSINGSAVHIPTDEIHGVGLWDSKIYQHRAITSPNWKISA